MTRVETNAPDVAMYRAMRTMQVPEKFDTTTPSAVFVVRI
jgi:hypothetical protein